MLNEEEKETLRKILWKLISAVNDREDGYRADWKAKLRSDPVLRSSVLETRVPGMKRSLRPYISQPRVGEYENEHLLRKLLSDVPAEDFVPRLVEQGDFVKGPPCSFDEWNEAKSWILERPELKAKGEPEVGCALVNFLTDFFSRVRPWTVHHPPPSYSRRIFDEFFDHLQKDLFADEIQLVLVAPCFGLDIEGVPFRFDRFTIRKLTEDELMGYGVRLRQETELDEPMDSEFEPPTSAFEWVVPAKRGQETKPPIEDSKKELLELCQSLALYKSGVPKCKDIFVVTPLYMEGHHRRIHFQDSDGRTFPHLVVRKGENPRLVAFLHLMKGPISLMKTSAELSLAFRWYLRSLNDESMNAKTIDITVSFEVLFGHRIGGRELGHWLALRCARLASAFGAKKRTPLTIMNDIQQAYSARNSIVHSGRLRTGTGETLRNALPRVQTYLRRSMTYILLALATGASLDAIMSDLDAAIETPTIVPTKWALKHGQLPLF